MTAAGKPTESGGKLTESAGKPTESGGKLTESGGKPTESGGKLTESAGKPTESGRGAGREQEAGGAGNRMQAEKSQGFKAAGTDDGQYAEK